jgi:hypothetical protein
MSYGINPVTGRCRQCGRAQVRLGTDGRGNVVDVPDPCPCPKVAPPKPKRTPAYRASVDAARRLACVCQLCDEPVHGKPKVSLYCATHRTEKEREAVARYKEKHGYADQNRWKARNQERVRQTARAYYQNDDERRERRNQYKRAWRKANREKIRAQKERAALRNFRDPAPAVKRWRERVAAGEHKPKPARRNKHGERLCCNGLCRQVVEGHARMCERCKDRLAGEARQQLRRAA